VQSKEGVTDIQTPGLNRAGINSTSSLLDLNQLWEGEMKQL